ncbi:hypothetical protein Pcinc_040739 [Petrolisthes cinctipes]|uniref:Uncharacterized protein n=1 Tax=Petrolisthes cinctipes TaxID=88211 RepID=A0AAE1BLA1_PETCI|nr:hypothetical protein Pcinc_040739 [Petrolisthes cinctipes]
MNVGGGEGLWEVVKVGGGWGDGGEWLWDVGDGGEGLRGGVGGGCKDDGSGRCERRVPFNSSLHFPQSPATLPFTFLSPLQPFPSLPSVPFNPSLHFPQSPSTLPFTSFSPLQPFPSLPSVPFNPSLHFPQSPSDLKGEKKLYPLFLLETAMGTLRGREWRLQSGEVR